jgi:acetolactate synthase-1/2/3 large subunit
MNMHLQGSDWLVESDVILTIDSAVPWIPRRCKPKSDAMVVHMGADPSYAMYPYRDFPASHLIAGSSGAGLRLLEKALQEMEFNKKKVELRRRKISGQIEAARRQQESLLASARSETPINAAWTAQCINSVKTDNAVIVNELGVPFSCLEFSGDEIFVGESTAGGLGSCIGIGLGAKLAARDRMVICCMGDGCFMFGNPTPAFLVSRALNIPITIIVANNGMWYAVEESTVDVYPDGAAADTDLMPLTRFGCSPDYAGIAVACGAYGETVTDPATLEDALRRGIEHNENGQAALIDVVTAPGTR